jgi:hypothetical protein
MTTWARLVSHGTESHSRMPSWRSAVPGTAEHESFVSTVDDENGCGVAMRGFCRPFRACWWGRVIPGRRHAFSVPCPGFLFLNIVKKLRICPFNRLELTFLTRGNEVDQGKDIVYAKTNIHPRNTFRCSTPASGGHKNAKRVKCISAYLSPAGGGGPAQAGPGVDSGPESLVAAMPRRAILDRPCGAPDRCDGIVRGLTESRIVYVLAGL